MASTKHFYEKIFGDPSKRKLRALEKDVERINALEPQFETLSDSELKAKTTKFQERLKDGETTEDILHEAFAVVREAAKRTLKMRHFDVQLIGGITMHRGQIAEMRTGEGKTLTATLPVYLNALEGKGVHLITVNDYLARRDAVWMGQIYDFLGLSIGVIQNQRETYVYDASIKGESLAEGSEGDKERDEDGAFKVQYDYLRTASRQEAYRCDITYGTNNEFGFDYLRDNMVQVIDQMVMRPGHEMHYAIIDEVDSILIDEARTPLIISAPAEQATEQYYHFAKLVRQLDAAEDYNVDEKLRSATLTEEGINKFEKWLGVENIYVSAGIRTVHHIEQALKAELLFKRDKEYVVESGEVIIIDEFTGRKMPGRRYSEGLHQAIEAKEGVEIQRESRTLATITFQNLFRMYGKLSGMTGTADTEEEELRSIYGLEVLVIPTNRPDARKDLDDRIYKTEEAKFQAVVKKVQECREKGQPILIGTISVERNELLSQYLSMSGIEHQALNAKNHEREGEIVAEAGRPGAVTLATNMAGRGVDIKLGGPHQEEYEKVVQAGGLFVLGTERHESRRIDNQLRGRSARQGDPGETQFFVSTEDDLMRVFGGDRLKTVMTRLNVPDDMPIEQKVITKMLETAQKKVEGHNYDIRKHLLSYDDILNRQRTAIYRKRRRTLELFDQSIKAEFQPEIVEESIELDEEKEENTEKAIRYTSTKQMIMEMVESEIEFVVSYHTHGGERDGEGKENFSGETTEEWNIQEIFETMRTIFPFSPEEKAHLFELGLREHEGRKLDDIEARDRIVNFLVEKAHKEYESMWQKIQASIKQEDEAKKIMRKVEKDILLRAMDTLWVDYLVDIQYLRQSIGLRGYGQRDPLVEYKKEAFYMFNALQDSIQKEVVYSFFKLSIGIELAPSIMADDKLVLEGAQKTSDSAKNVLKSGPAEAKKKKMSKKERRKQKTS
ncbi:MAG: preprotein translocase subunit SecA [Candidatus Magasanikbacteria bacterium CG11_big_fil_rev_8_21_14_0_20_39_34]|uniref:Protein translocase subunit SecA n=1 Tax=Candidatus Magasanikbacteria bacterium CG11_big_fil_rev_8_21_14_0_20_39_34 TaxID=1974653 RepID=A0A2H0N530_9BACT|nr:MAG: preprotein translocase subunit SecA [Candidatus Magasanikbacteria bacterium CG11_big_fil_rev_8_21_14_0_20_39_34]